ncbi:MAG: uroporphyrinogen-III synthase [Steroidobacteraceae bacterium]
MTERRLLTDGPLSGKTIAIPETRELDVFAAMLERRGAIVLRCPLVAILDAPDPAPILGWIRQFNSGACDDLILLTGEGLRRLLGCIDRHEPALRAGFVERLAQVRKVTRGPKPARALRELGLKPEIAAEVPTTAGVIAALAPLDLAGRRVGVQLYGTEPNLPLIEFLQRAGAAPVTVAPYVYADKTADESVRALLNHLANGTVDAIAFTSTPQVTRLFAVADAATVQSALARTLVAAVGPVVAETLAARGIKAQITPTESFFLKPLTTALEAALGAKRETWNREAPEVGK